MNNEKFQEIAKIWVDIKELRNVVNDFFSHEKKGEFFLPANTEIAKVIGRSEGTVRKAKKANPAKYGEFLAAYLLGMKIEEYNKQKLMKIISDREKQMKIKENEDKPNIIMVANFKGGVGKSTIARFIQEYIPYSKIVNIDFQEASKFNPENTTIDFQILKEEDPTLSFFDLVSILATDPDIQAKNIIVDTQGNELNEEMYEALPVTDYIIIPTNAGSRSIDRTMLTIKALLDQEDMISDKMKWAIVINNHTLRENDLNEKKKEIEEAAREMLGDKLMCVTDLPFSKIVEKLEHNPEFLTELSFDQKIIYRNFERKVLKMVEDLKNKLFV